MPRKNKNGKPTPPVNPAPAGPGRVAEPSGGGSRLLDRIESPADLKRLSIGQLAGVAEELRQMIIQTVSRRGGHLASNLGVIDLTVALHTVFDFPRDLLLWDVGHQCYAHKILTGRRDRFDTLRQAGGIGGFPDPSESEFDLFATGHAGSAISTASGLALADLLRGRSDRCVVAVVGDASIVNGLSLEAMNNVALLKRQFLVVLNDNSMAIDVTQGALAGVLDRIRLTQTYSGFKHSAEQVLRRLPLGEEVAGALRQLKDGIRTAVHGEQLFEPLGFRYFGPVDGHDMDALLTMLRRVGAAPHPVLLHVHTQKGHGCQYAVEDPCRFHSPGAHTVNGDVVEFPSPPRPSWTKVFSEALLERARRDERIVAITAAMPDGTGLDAIRDALPQRYLDVGINESHAVAMAAGLAKAGLRPVVALYSTFLQRAFDQVFQEVALQNLPVVLCLDRAGLCGSDGAVHHGFCDITCLRALPGMVLMSPADATELRSALDLALSLEGPSAIRYPRDEAPESLTRATAVPYHVGKSQLIRAGTDGALLALGAMAETARSAAEILAREHGIEVAVYSARFAKPLDEQTLADLLTGGKPVVTVEDHAVAGGFGSAVLELAAARSLPTGNVALVGLSDRLFPHASRAQQLTQAGLDADSLVATMIRCLEHHGASQSAET